MTEIKRVSGEYSGGSVNYYKLPINNPINLPDPYIAECDDIIAALGLTFAEGCQFKALWRVGAARTLSLFKDGMDEHGVYDGDKGVYYARVTQGVRHASAARAATAPVAGSAEGQTETTPVSGTLGLRKISKLSELYTGQYVHTAVQGDSELRYSMVLGRESVRSDNIVLANVTGSQSHGPFIIATLSDLWALPTEETMARARGGPAFDLDTRPYRLIELGCTHSTRDGALFHPVNFALLDGEVGVYLTTPAQELGNRKDELKGTLPLSKLLSL